MNASSIGALPMIKRRRKIQYQKPRGRLQQRSAGVLNKSICRKNVKGNDSICNQSQLVAVKDINSFLEKNRELAKALEESRSQTKELEKYKFTYQSECIEMREKVSLFQNAILRCTCNKDTSIDSLGNYDLLTDVEATLKQSMNYLSRYISSIAMCFINQNKVGQGKPALNIQNTSSHVNKFTQTTNVSTKDVDVQCMPVKFKNKKFQVDMTKCDDNFKCDRLHIDNGGVEGKVFAETGTQSYTNLIQTKHQEIQCSLPVVMSHLRDNPKVAMKSNTSKHQTNLRQPLAVVQTEDVIRRNQQNCTNKQPISILKTVKKVQKSKMKSSFSIYEDSPSYSNKENQSYENVKDKINRKSKNVTIYSPAQIRIFDSTPNNVDDRFRQKKHVGSYKEPSLKRKLTKRDPCVDTRFCNSPYRKAKKTAKKKRAKNRLNITLEEIVSMVEESYLATHVPKKTEH